MGKRLLEVKGALPDVIAKHLAVDNLLVTEWAKLEELISLLEPFTTITNLLQSNAQSLCYIYPSLLEIDCHLSSFQTTTAAAKKAVASILQDFRSRFEIILKPELVVHGTKKFNPVPVAATLLHPGVACIILLPDNKELLDAAKNYIVIEVSSY